MQSIVLPLNHAEVEQAETLLFDFGATAVTLEDADDVPQLEPKPGEVLLWPTCVLTAWFERELSLEPLIIQLKETFPQTTLTHALVEPDDWEKNLHAGFKPLYFGEQLAICPSWDTLPDTNRKVLNLDPGLAFGTGTHPTTAMCLTWLSDHLTSDQTVLDYGCGSGILGLAALKLGAKHVWAVDYDPQAIQSTLANAEKNQLPRESLTVLAPTDTNNIPKVDVIIANILAGPLTELAPIFRNFARNGTKLVLSGILKTQKASVKSAYADWVIFTEETIQEDWVCLSAYFNLPND